MATRLALPREQVFGDAGTPLPGAKLYFYAAGTSTPKATYLDEGLSTPNANPVVADSAGRFGDIFLATGQYKVVLQTTAGVTVWTADPMDGAPDPIGDVSAGTVKPASGTTLLSLATLYGYVANVRHYGAAGDGTTDDTAAIALAAATGRTVYFPPGSYKMTAKVSLTANGQRVVADQGVIVPVGNLDVFEFTGGTVGGGVDGLRFDGAGHTGGFLVTVRNANRVVLNNVVADGCYNGAYVEQANQVTFRDWWVQSVTGPYIWILYGTPSLRTDVVAFHNCTASASSAVAYANRAVGLTIDGNVHTVTTSGLRFVLVSRGVVAQNTTGGVFPASTPAFFQSSDLEVDYPYYQAVLLISAWSFHFVNPYLCNSVTTENVSISSGAHIGSMTNGFISGGAKEGMIFDGKDWAFANNLIVGNSFATANLGLYDGVRIGGNTRRVTFTSCHSGQREGIGATQRYGVIAESGAANISWCGGNLSGNLQEPWRDDSGGGNDNFEIIANGSNLSVTDNVIFGTAAGFRATGTVTVLAGAITAATVTGGGRFYSAAPSVFAYDPAGTGTGATFTASVSGGVVTAVAVNTAGTNYSAGTLLYFRPAAIEPIILPYSASGSSTNLTLGASGTSSVVLQNESGAAITASPVLFGVYGAAGTAKPTITGSRGANAALTSLLTALAAQGLLTDSTT